MINFGMEFLRTAPVILQRILSPLVLLSVYCYRIFFSRFKGFRCAYSVQTGKGSCSDHAVHVLKSYPLGMALEMQRMQFERCCHSKVQFLLTGKSDVPRPRADLCDIHCFLVRRDKTK